MSTHKASKILSAGKLKQSTRPTPYGKQQTCKKIILYVVSDDLVAIESAVRACSAADLAGADSAGNFHGRAVAAICKQWLKGRAK